MKIGHALLSVAFALSPASVLANGMPNDDGVASPDRPAAEAVQVEPVPVETAASTQVIRTAIANAFHASEQGVPCSGKEGLGCSIAETALGSALSDEREEDKANQFFRER